MTMHDAFISTLLSVMLIAIANKDWIRILFLFIFLSLQDLHC